LHVGETEYSISLIQEAIAGLEENQKILRNLLDIFDIEEIPKNIEKLLEVKFGEL
jgi:nitrogenase molybdenum-iron protein alpha/beta subunit